MAMRSALDTWIEVQLVLLAESIKLVGRSSCIASFGIGTRILNAQTFARRYRNAIPRVASVSIISRFYDSVWQLLLWTNAPLPQLSWSSLRICLRLSALIMSAIISTYRRTFIT